MTADISRVVDAVWRMESAKLIAALTRVTGDVGLADVTGDAGQRTDDPGGLHAPDGVDDAVQVRGRRRRPGRRGAHASRWAVSVSRSSFSFSCSSGVNASPKSSGTEKGRISSSPPRKGALRAHSTASSLEETSKTQ